MTAPTQTVQGARYGNRVAAEAALTRSRADTHKREAVIDRRPAAQPPMFGVQKTGATFTRTASFVDENIITGKMRAILSQALAAYFLFLAEYLPSSLLLYRPVSQ